jgi:hypothetical protein
MGVNLLVLTHLRQGCVWHAGRLQVVEKAMHDASSFTAAVKTRRRECGLTEIILKQPAKK